VELEALARDLLLLAFELLEEVRVIALEGASTRTEEVDSIVQSRSSSGKGAFFLAQLGELRLGILRLVVHEIPYRTRLATSLASLVGGSNASWAIRLDEENGRLREGGAAP
jgi:hypothetical protein